MLMRVFSVDALRCPKCATPMVVLAFLSDPPVVRRILHHLGLVGEEARSTPHHPAAESDAVPEPVCDIEWGDEVRAPDGSALIDEGGDGGRSEEDGEERLDPYLERDDWDPP